MYILFFVLICIAIWFFESFDKTLSLLSMKNKKVTPVDIASSIQMRFNDRMIKNLFR